MNETDLQLTDGRTLHVYDSGTGDLPVFWNHGTPNLGAPPAPLLADVRTARHPLGLLRPARVRRVVAGSRPDDGLGRARRGRGRR